MSTATHRLSKLVLDEISLVDSPANTGARVVFWKRDGADASTVVKTDEEKTFYGALSDDDKARWDKMDQDGRSRWMKEKGEMAKADDDAKMAQDLAAVNKANTDLKAELEGVSKANAELKTELAELKTKLAKADETEARLAKAESSLAEMQARDRVAKLAGELEGAHVANAAEVAEMLEKILDDETRKAVRKRIETDAAAVHNASIFTAIGSTAAGPSPSSAEGELQALARKRAADSGGREDFETAYANIYKSDGALRGRIAEERAIAKRGMV